MVATNLRDFYLQLSGLGPTAGQGTQAAATQWAVNTSWAGRFLSVTADWDVNATLIHEARSLGWSITLTTHGSPRWRARTHKTRGTPMENLTQALQAQSAAGLVGTQVLMEYMCEDDSAGVGFPQDLLTLARSAGYSNGATLMQPYEAMDAWAEYVQEAHAAIAQWPLARRHARVGWPSSVHSVAPFTDSVLVELTNDDVGSAAPAPAFARGAARQFNITWGVDLSLWWGVIHGCVQDLPASLQRRVLALAYVGGASVVSVEGCGWLDLLSDQPNHIAQEVDRFGRLLTNGLPPSLRGMPDATAQGVALVLPPELGWTERPSWSAATPTLWSYANIPVSAVRGAAAIDGLLSAFFPGISASGAFGFLAFPFGEFEDDRHPAASPFARSAVLPPYAPDAKDVFYARSNLPFGAFHDRDELHKWFQSHETGGRDPAPLRPMADSRWGDILDILVADPEGRWESMLANLGNPKTDGYQVVIWSNTSMTPEAASALRAYAERGGEVVVAIGAAGPVEASLTGVVPNGEQRAVRAWRWLAAGSFGTETATVHADHFLTATINRSASYDVSEIDVMAVSEPDKYPLVVRNAVGRGHVYTCLIPWFGSDQLAPPALSLLEHVLMPAQPLTIVEGVPALYWTTSTLLPQRKGRVAAVSNNADAMWQGKLQIRIGDSGSAQCARVVCEDLWSGDSIPCIPASMPDSGAGYGSAILALVINAHDVALLQVLCVED